jgi:hypothetical protein
MASRGANSNDAVIFGSFTRDRAGRPIGLADADSIQMLVDCGHDDADEELMILRKHRIACVEGEVEFKNPLLIVVRRVEGEFLAEALSLPLGSVGGTREEAVGMLEELFVASYFFYLSKRKGELTSEGSLMKSALRRMVKSAVEANDG